MGYSPGRFRWIFFFRQASELAESGFLVAAGREMPFDIVEPERHG